MIKALIGLCREGSLEKVKNFIADNPDIDIHIENETVFIVAVSEDNLELVKYFVEECQVDVDACEEIAAELRKENRFKRNLEMLKNSAKKIQPVRCRRYPKNGGF